MMLLLINVIAKNHFQPSLRDGNGENFTFIPTNKLVGYFHDVPSGLNCCIVIHINVIVYIIL
jgi:hypothetical protein